MLYARVSNISEQVRGYFFSENGPPDVELCSERLVLIQEDAGEVRSIMANHILDFLD